MVAAENERDPTRVPTRANLLRAMRWLVEGSGSGDSLVFHFSGHGVQKLDLNDDEVDGYNEALCPADFEQSGKILDDEINEIIVRPLGRGVKLHAVVDTCHSGTILDLPYLCRLSRYAPCDQKTKSFREIIAPAIKQT
jgi:metacaspase-1